MSSLSYALSLLSLFPGPEFYLVCLEAFEAFGKGHLSTHNGGTKVWDSKHVADPLRRQRLQLSELWKGGREALYS